MKKRSFLIVSLLLVITLSILLGQSPLCFAKTSPVPGAIFTTDETGLLVDGNIYADELDVYLSGGPGPNAPPGAAGLPDGEYYFQVTDPPGKNLLSTDDVKERKFLVEGGVISQYLGTTHAWNDISSEIPNAIAIQLWPFSKTPNEGGEYKAWATPVKDYKPRNGKSSFGFIPRYSKTDNYKVRRAKLILDKFNDVNGNGTYDAGDMMIPDWRIDVTDPLGVTTTYLTPKTLEITELGTYIIKEDLPADWEQTAVRVDGTYKMPPTLEVTVLINIGETHDVLYGNMLPPECTVYFYTDPTDIGDITVDGKTYWNGDFDVWNYCDVFTAVANAPAGWLFDHWEVMGNIDVLEEVENTIRVHILCGGSIKAYFTPRPPPATINLYLNPALPGYVRPGGTVSFWWTITFLSTPKLVTLEVTNPAGTVVYTNSWDVTGATSPITGSDSWTVPAGATLGYYRVTVKYYSVEIGSTIPEAIATRVFWVHIPT